MKKTRPLLAVTALSAELLLARTARADAEQAQPAAPSPAAAPSVAAAPSMVGAVGGTITTLASRLVRALETAPFRHVPPASRAPLPPRPQEARPCSGNGKRSCYDDEDGDA